MVRIALLAAAWLVLPIGGALAGPPDVSGLGRPAQIALLHETVRANIAGVNCADYQTTDSQWRFLVDTADAIADALQLDVGLYDGKFYKPAFAALDADPAFCMREGALVVPLIERLVAMGGKVDKYKLPR